MQACCISMCFFTPFSAKMRAHSCKCDAAVYQIFGKCPRHNRHCSNPNITRLLSKLWSSILNGLERSHAIYFCQISTYIMENFKMRYFFRNKKFEVNQMFQQNVINLLYLMYISMKIYIVFSKFSFLATYDFPPYECPGQCNNAT